MKKRILVLTSLFSIVFSLLFLFNNCSKVEFENIDPQSQQDGHGQNNDALGDHDNHEKSDDDDTDPGIIASDNDIDSLLDNLTDEEIDNPIPVVEIINDPSLADRYRCPDGGVMICHFPTNVEAAGSSCVGEASIKSHFSHIRTYDLGEGLKSISDYLGPCRIDL